MKLNENLVDFDLDVRNILKSFPKNDKDACVYISGTKENDWSNSTGYIFTAGEPEALTPLIYKALNEYNIRFAIYNAVINYIMKNQSAKEEFVKAMENYNTMINTLSDNGKSL